MEGREKGMRVLWVCNIMLPAVAKALGEPYSVREGWLTGCLDRLLQEKDTELELGICFPAEGELADLSRKIVLKPMGAVEIKQSSCAETDCPGREISCYGFGEDLQRPEQYDYAMEPRFGQILSDFQPDIVHIFGTEFPHACACAKVWNRPERTLVGIQGLCGPIAEAYMADLPEKVCRAKTLRDILRKDSLMEQQQKFRVRGVREQKLLSLTGHITGRTEFDRTETAKIQPKAQYHLMNETMRGSFYTDCWEADKCRKGRLFLSQGDYPLKGFHYLLAAMKDVIPDCPDVEIVVAGNSVLGMDGWKSRLKIPAYGVYLRRLMKKNGMNGKVHVLGMLSEEQMKQTYLSSHIVICPSALENSPNSVAEAMLLGVPVVASKTGGIPSMIEDGKDGLLFEKGNPKALAECIRKILLDEKLAQNLSVEERKRAAKVHDGEANYNRLLEIYEEIV